MERLIRRWLHPIAPVYRRELARAQALHIPHIGCISIIVIGLMCFSSGLVLLLVVPILRLWVVVATSDAIAYEVENGTWTTLRTIPYSTRELVRAKYAGALVRARRLFYILVVLRVVVTLLIFAISFLLLSSIMSINTYTYNTTTGATTSSSSTTTAFVDIGLFLSAFVFIVLDAMLDFITDGALGIVASAFASTPGRAMALAFGLGAASMFAQYLTLFFLLLSFFLSLSPTPASYYSSYAV